MTGKNFSCNNQGKRKKSDFYETPYSITGQLLTILFNAGDVDNSVLEPACGNGAITSVLNKVYNNVTSYDIETNFLKETRKFDIVITNPPFSIAFDFINQAKLVTNKWFAFLLPLSYLHGKKRFDYIWSDSNFPLSSVYVFTRYPMLGDNLRTDGKYKTGMMVYAWYVWDKSHVGEPVIKWIDNNSYVLNKGDK